MEKNRGNGRDDFLIHTMWNAVIAGIVFQHESIESLIRALSRNSKLLTVCCFDLIPVQRKPTARIVKNQETGAVVKSGLTENLKNISLKRNQKDSEWRNIFNERHLSQKVCNKVI